MECPLIKAVRNKAPYETLCDLVYKHLRQTDSQGRTALMHAIITGNIEATRLLIPEAGIFDSFGKNAYIYAYENGMTELMDLLEAQYPDQEVQVKKPDSTETVW